MMGVNLNDPNIPSIDKFYAQQFQSRIKPNTPYENFANFLKSKEGQNYINGSNEESENRNNKNNRRIM